MVGEQPTASGILELCFSFGLESVLLRIPAHDLGRDPEIKLHIERPFSYPLEDVFEIAGWIASKQQVLGIRGAEGEWLTLCDRPDVAKAFPDHAYCVGFSGTLGLGAKQESGLCLSIRFESGEEPYPLPMKAVVLPPDHLQIRQVGGVWGRNFYRTGERMGREIADMFFAAGKSLHDAPAILDFGCGCGRVLRSFESFPRTGQIHGCDVDDEAIRWNQANLSTIAQFTTNAALPPMPFADASFDAIYSVSVFTHLPEDVQFAWLAELQRILRPGGMILASLHGERYWSQDPGVHAEVLSRGFAYRRGEPTEGLPDYYMVAFHSESYVRERWSAHFDIVSYRPAYIYGVHDAVLLRRKDPAI